MMLYSLLKSQFEAMHRNSLSWVDQTSDWELEVFQRRKEWLEMLGIRKSHLRGVPRVRKSDITKLDRVTVQPMALEILKDNWLGTNLWMPKNIRDKAKVIIYLCGPSPEGKAHYQPIARWYAEHGFACMVLDAIQIGEGQGEHHGIFLEKHWDWLSAGYTPAGAEVLAVVKTLNYLERRDELDLSQCIVTGISGGATMSVYSAAVDERLKICLPICIAGTLRQIFLRRSLDLHCDCTFWVNSKQWEVADVAALIAPRHLSLFFNTHDCLCDPGPMRELSVRLKRIWEMLDSLDTFMAVENVAPHAYTRPILAKSLDYLSSLTGVDTGEVRFPDYIIQSAVFSFDMKKQVDAKKLNALKGIPKKKRMRSIKEAMTRPSRMSSGVSYIKTCSLLKKQIFKDWESGYVPELIEECDFGRSVSGVSFHDISFRAADDFTIHCHTQKPIEREHFSWLFTPCCEDAVRIMQGQGANLCEHDVQGFAQSVIEVRGTGQTALGRHNSWFIRRSYGLLGQSLYERQTMDLIWGIQGMVSREKIRKYTVYVEGRQTPVGLFAALLLKAKRLVLKNPVWSLCDNGPEFPGILKIGDIADFLGMLNYTTNLYLIEERKKLDLPAAVKKKLSAVKFKRIASLRYLGTSSDSFRPPR